MARSTSAEMRAEQRAQQDQEDQEDRELIESPPDASFKTICMMIPLFENLKKDIIDLEMVVARLKKRISQLEDA